MVKVQTQTPEQLMRDLRGGDLEGAKAVIRAFVERDGNCRGTVVGILAKMQGSRLWDLIEELDDYRREISGQADPTEPFYR